MFDIRNKYILNNMLSEVWSYSISFCSVWLFFSFCIFFLSLISFHLYLHIYSSYCSLSVSQFYQSFFLLLIFSFLFLSILSFLSHFLCSSFCLFSNAALINSFEYRNNIENHWNIMLTYSYDIPNHQGNLLI